MAGEDVREPLVPLTTAFILLGLVGVVCTFALYALLGRRYLTEDERYRCSAAIITSLIATLVGCGALALILPNAKAKTHPGASDGNARVSPPAHCSRC